MSEQETSFSSDVPRNPDVRASEDVARHERALTALEEHIGALRTPALEEIIRVLSAGVLDSFVEEDLRAVADRRVVQVNGEQYFGKAFSGGKETETILRIAKDLGPAVTLEKLSQLKGLIGGKENID